MRGVRFLMIFLITLLLSGCPWWPLDDIIEVYIEDFAMANGGYLIVRAYDSEGTLIAITKICEGPISDGRAWVLPRELGEPCGEAYIFKGGKRYNLDISVDMDNDGIYLESGEYWLYTNSLGNPISIKMDGETILDYTGIDFIQLP